jgi:hypothetical protein
MSRDGAMSALAGALVTAGPPGCGSVRPLVLVDSVQSDPYYLRFPAIRMAVYEQGAIRWERPSGRGRWQSCSGVVAREGKALCGV